MSKAEKHAPASAPSEAVNEGTRSLATGDVDNGPVSYGGSKAAGATTKPLDTN
jgi:hypothetical protein